MTILQIIAVLITLTALFSYLNFRFIGLPTTIGVMLIALLASLALIAVGESVPEFAQGAEHALKRLDFDSTVLEVMLSFLLFAGALHIDLDDLAEQRGVIAVLAGIGVLISTFLFGTAIWFVTQALGMPLGYAWCLLFGSLVSPTDPIAVIGILKRARVPKSLEVKIAGESLFNDGIGVVVFIVLQGIAVSGHDIDAVEITRLFAQEAVGGALLGLGLGWITYHLIKSVDAYSVEILLTLALVVGGYALASALHMSGPIAMVVAGLLIGNHGRRFAMSEKTRERLDTFWELNDEILNAVLFVLIGLEVLVLAFTRDMLLVGVAAIPLLLLARLTSVGLPVMTMRRWRSFTPGAVAIMTWGGLRGGISIALALSLPPGPERSLIVAATYIVVIFSIAVQGLSMGAVVRRWLPKA